MTFREFIKTGTSQEKYIFTFIFIFVVALFIQAAAEVGFILPLSVDDFVVDSHGNIVAASNFHHRIYYISKKGRLINSIGLPEGNGSIRLSIDTSDNLYMTRVGGIVDVYSQNRLSASYYVPKDIGYNWFLEKDYKVANSYRASTFTPAVGNRRPVKFGDYLFREMNSDSEPDDFVTPTRIYSLSLFWKDEVSVYDLQGNLLYIVKLTPFYLKIFACPTPFPGILVVLVFIGWMQDKLLQKQRKRRKKEESALKMEFKELIPDQKTGPPLEKSDCSASAPLRLHVHTNDIEATIKKELCSSDETILWYHHRKLSPFGLAITTLWFAFGLSMYLYVISGASDWWLAMIILLPITLGFFVLPLAVTLSDAEIYVITNYRVMIICRYVLGRKVTKEVELTRVKSISFINQSHNPGVLFELRDERDAMQKEFDEKLDRTLHSIRRGLPVGIRSYTNPTISFERLSNFDVYSYSELCELIRTSANFKGYII